MIRANKIRIYPTAEQETYFRQACGVARFTYNWGLAEWTKQYKEGGKPTAYGMVKQLNAIKREQFPWMLDVTKYAAEIPLHNLEFAFKAFFAKRRKYPNFKKKGASNDSFAIDGKNVKVTDKELKLPKQPTIKMSRPLFHQGRIIKCTVSRKADRWYASVVVECADKQPSENQAVVGVDVGITTAFTLSTGEKIANPRHLKGKLKRLARYQRKMDRRKAGSNNRQKAKLKVARLHASVTNRRNGFLHKVTSKLAKEFGTVVIEDLNVKGMVKGNLSQSILDVGFGEFRRQLTYKMPDRVILADRYFPSSQLCSTCGFRHKELKRGDKEWTCQSCGTHHNRDVNAAMNLVGLYRPDFKPVEIGAVGPVVEAGRFESEPISFEEI